MQQIVVQVSDELAERFLREVPEGERSSFVGDVLERRLSKRPLTDEEWEAAAEVANDDPEVRQIELEMASLPDTMSEEPNDFFWLPKAG